MNKKKNQPVKFPARVELVKNFPLTFFNNGTLIQSTEVMEVGNISIQIYRWHKTKKGKYQYALNVFGIVQDK